MSELTCEQRINGHLTGRLAEMIVPKCKKCGETLQSYEVDDSDRCPYCDKKHKADNNMPEPLSIDTTRVINVMLSTGGPGDGFKIHVNDNYVLSVKYWFNDWFDYAEKELHGEELETAKEYLESLYIDEDLDWS